MGMTVERYSTQTSLLHDTTNQTDEIPTLLTSTKRLNTSACMMTSLHGESRSATVSGTGAGLGWSSVGPAGAAAAGPRSSADARRHVLPGGRCAHDSPVRGAATTRLPAPPSSARLPPPPMVKGRVEPRRRRPERHLSRWAPPAAAAAVPGLRRRGALSGASGDVRRSVCKKDI